MKTTVNENENLIRNENKYNIVSLDLSKDGDKKCSKWSSLGFEIFEIIILATLALTLSYWLGKRTCEEEGWLVIQNEVVKKKVRRKEI